MDDEHEQDEPAEPQQARRKKRLTGRNTGTSQEAVRARRLLFAREYLTDLNATAAAVRVGYAASGAQTRATELLREPTVLAEIERLRAAALIRLDMTLDDVLLDAALVLTADARELVDVRAECCRHCWGEGHRRQRTQRERDAAYAEWSKRAAARKGPSQPFDEEGGIGFDRRRPPSPDCPECLGDGHSRIVLHDTRHLSASAVRLYAGARKLSQGGLQVIMRDKDTARETLMKHLGGYLADNSQRRSALGDAVAELMGGIHAADAGRLTHTATPTPLRAVPGGKKAAGA